LDPQRGTRWAPVAVRRASPLIVVRDATSYAEPKPVHHAPAHMSVAPTQGNQVRLAELLAALTLATDLANEFPPEKALRNALLAVGLGRELGLEDSDLSDAYYLALLRYLGCTGSSHEEALAAGGDDNRLRATFAAADHANPADLARAAARRVFRDPLRGTRMMASLLGARALMLAIHANNCEAGQRLASRLGVSADVSAGLTQIFNRWDGRLVGGAGEATSLPARIAHFVHAAELIHRFEGRRAVVAVVSRRSGTDFDPAISAAFLAASDSLLEAIEGESHWDQALEAEPRPWLQVRAVGLDRLIEAFADFADLKSPYTLGHSRFLAELVEAAGGGPELRRAALLHDLGRVSVPNGIWEKPGPLNAAEWERVRLYPYHTERILTRSTLLRSYARVASSQQELLDGSGYHRGLATAALPPAARLLAAADHFRAMIEERPHRAALPPARAAAELEAEVLAGRLDADAVAAVLTAAGRQPLRSTRHYPAGLSGREVEVLRLVARGHTNREIARTLVISEATVHHHVLHVYGKIGASSRAGAALFALEHDLLH
jgi:DNA-binding CsgD family transcriptional regulator